MKRNDNTCFKDLNTKEKCETTKCTKDYSFESALQFFQNRGLITFYDVRSLTEDQLMHKLLKELHPYAISFAEKEGRWRTTVVDYTKPSGRRSVARKTRRELEKYLIEHYHITLDPKEALPAITFKEAFELSQENKLCLKKDKEKLISAKNTAIKNNSEYRRYFAGTEFESKPIDAITKDDIEDISFYNLNRYDLRKKAFLSLRGIIKSTLEFAFQKKWTDENAYHRVDFKKFDDMLLAETPIEERAHSESELAAILDVLHKKQLSRPSCSSYWALEMQILAGLRCGEIPPLEWDTDVSETEVYIHRTQLESEDGLVIVNHTKTYKNRHFPIDNRLLDFLIRLKDMHDTYYSDSPFLFPGNTQNGTISNKAVYYVYQKICKKLGIEILENVIRGPHSFRRNIATDIVNNSNGDINLAAGMIGNSPKVLSTNYYTGINMERGRDALNKRKLDAS